MGFPAGCFAGRRDGDAGAAAGRGESPGLADRPCGAARRGGGAAVRGTAERGTRPAVAADCDGHDGGRVRTAIRPFRAAGLLLGAAGLLGGTIQALSGATGSKATGLLLGTLAIPLLSAAMIRASRMRRDVQTVRVRMTYKKRTARFSAVVDSGNCLRDYLTHRPVIVIPQARGNRLFGLEDTPLRPIFADTAGGRQMMFCLTPERTILCDGRNEWAVEAMLGTFAGAWGTPGSAARPRC